MTLRERLMTYTYWVTWVSPQQSVYCDGCGYNDFNIVICQSRLLVSSIPLLLYFKAWQIRNLLKEGKVTAVVITIYFFTADKLPRIRCWVSAIFFQRTPISNLIANSARRDRKVRNRLKNIYCLGPGFNLVLVSTSRMDCLHGAYVPVAQKNRTCGNRLFLINCLIGFIKNANSNLYRTDCLYIVNGSFN